MWYRQGAIAAGLVVTAATLAACANHGETTAASASGTPQTASIASPPPVPQAQAPAPQDLRLYFDSGRSQVRPDSRAVLDQAARLFREGDPLVMTVSGLADSSGDPRRNLLLSQERAANVARGLMDRGIPAARLQLIAKGESEPVVKTADGVAQPENRAVIITWRK